MGIFLLGFYFLMLYLMCQDTKTHKPDLPAGLPASQ